MNECTLTSINEIMNNYSQRTGIELLLVGLGIKRGDCIDWLKQTNPDFMNKTLKIINKSGSMNLFTAKDNKFNQVYYYNKQNTSKDLIYMMKSLGQFNDSLVRFTEATFYQIPLCCIIADEFNKSIKEPMPMTEHYWCKPDCKASKRIQQEYTQAVMTYLPEYAHLTKKSLIDLY